MLLDGRMVFHFLGVHSGFSNLPFSRGPSQSLPWSQRAVQDGSFEFPAPSFYRDLEDERLASAYKSILAYPSTSALGSTCTYLLSC